MSDRDEIKIRFETSAKYAYGGCGVAYGRLYIDDMHMPALRLCVDTHIIDLPLKVNNGLTIVEKAPHFLQIPPYRYVACATAPDVLYLITTWETKRAFCNADATTCAKLPPAIYGPATIKYVYTVLRSALA
jgi:hypothetical protein